MKSPGVMVIGPTTIETINKVISTIETINKVISAIDEIRIPVADISPENEKIKIISQAHSFYYDSITGMDYNFDKLSDKKYSTIFCLEVLEHLQNPLLFMQNIKEMMTDNSILYLSMPGRLKLFWLDCHYFEIPPKHFQKWILEPLELKLIKKTFIQNVYKLTLKDFIGFRPVLRTILKRYNGSYLYKITL